MTSRDLRSRARGWPRLRGDGARAKCAHDQSRLYSCPTVARIHAGIVDGGG
jgi:hypothetical protein